MELAIRHEAVACDGCKQKTFLLLTVDGNKLCERCAETSVRIDRLLVGVSADDPVACDGCARPVDFDARIAIVTRECGGAVLCDGCKPVAIEGAPAS